MGNPLTAAGSIFTPWAKNGQEKERGGAKKRVGKEEEEEEADCVKYGGRQIYGLPLFPPFPFSFSSPCQDRLLFRKLKKASKAQETMVRTVLERVFLGGGALDIQQHAMC